MSSSLHMETWTSVRSALDGLASLGAFGRVHVASENGPLAVGAYSAMRPSPQLIFCLDGHPNYWIRREDVGTRLVLDPGDVIVLPGGVWVGLDPIEHYRTFGISLFPEMVHCYLVQPGRRGEPHPSGGKSRTFGALTDNSRSPAIPGEFERIDYLDELDRPSGPDQTAEQLVATLAINAGRSSADPLLGHLLKALVLRIREVIASPHAPAGSKAEATFGRIKRYVIANCDKPLDRERVAEAVGVHPRHVSNLFNRFGDETLSQFMLRARLERARRLLSSSDTSVTEVGQICGFAGPNHFVRAFRQRFGAPPGKYRTATVRLTERAL